MDAITGILTLLVLVGAACFFLMGVLSLLARDKNGGD